MDMVDEFYISKMEYFNNDGTKMDWRKWLALGQSLSLDKRRVFMWIWPTEIELQKFGLILKSNQIKHILSVGCGNGLFEWIMQQSLVYGVEVDRSWWESKYAIKNFIKLNYIDDLNSKDQGYLKKCCTLQTWDFTLMFCYFNNRTAFNNYLQMYKGGSLMIIGPRAEMGIVTDPFPLEPQFPEQQKWSLNTTLNIGKVDVIALYSRIEQEIFAAEGHNFYVVVVILLCKLCTKRFCTD
ncbi:uncharacterized protein [Eurosta solidaginis]|uniref:uncharacterized protein isoform X2 n=1 Tax=Eurosta solidaginis TaxID=178769 RepID=UPI0035305FB8